MKTILIRLVLLVLSLPMASLAKEHLDGQPGQSPALKDAVILIIRHAEKPGSGQGLSLAGEQRAEAYVHYFQNFTLDAKPLKLDHLFATADSEQSHRPRLTAGPLSRALGLKIDARFANKKFQELADELRAKDHGRQILICWHHGEIPELARVLGADPGKLLPEGKWPSQTFDWVLQLRYDQAGRLIAEETKRINENLMPGDRP